MGLSSVAIAGPHMIQGCLPYVNVGVVELMCHMDWVGANDLSDSILQANNLSSERENHSASRIKNLEKRVRPRAAKAPGARVGRGIFVQGKRPNFARACT